MIALDRTCSGLPLGIRWRSWLCIIAAIVAMAPSLTMGEDVVFTRGKPPNERVQKRGEIVDWSGGQLRLRGALGREEAIPSDRILEIQTSQTTAEQSARRLLAEGKLDEAITAFYEARRDETRAWAVRQISAELAIALLEAGRPNLAGDEFLTITAADPSTHLFDAIPLAWRTTSIDGPLLVQASSWLRSDSDTARLLGASWLLPTAHREQAIATLERLRTSRDRRIAAAAEVQLWRTRIVTVGPDEIKRWETAAGKIPAELRSVAWFQIGEALARQGQAEEAALAYLQTALSYNRQRAMAADALVAAGGQLESLGRASQAAELYREVLRDFHAADARAEAQARLDALAKQASR